jgi:YVTN family beta-propeller protein
MLEFHILGPVEAVEQQRALPLGGSRQRALLAILVLHRGEALTSDRLIDELWGERPPATAAKTLQGYVSRLRRVLGPDVLLTRAGGYVLAAAPEQVDAERFERLAAGAREALARGDPAGARDQLRSALALWRGDALADLAYEPFAARQVARLEEARRAAIEDRIDAELALGADRELIGELEALVAAHPVRERPREQLMLAMYRCGRHAEALEVYRRARTALSDELGLEPGPTLRELEQRILEHDPSLRPSRASAAVRAQLGSRWSRAALAGALLLAGAIATAAIELATGGSTPSLRVAPNEVGAIDVATDRVVARVAVGARPGPIAYGAGSLWIANLDDQTISRVNPRTLATQRTIALAQQPTGIAATRQAIWVTTSSITSTSVAVDRIDPEFDDVTVAVRLGDVADDTPTAVSGGTSLWVAPYAGLVSRLDPATGQVLRQIDPNAAPAGLAVGDGAVWMTDAEANTVTAIDADGTSAVVPVEPSPAGIAIGDGGVWVADTGEDAVVRIDPQTHAVTATIPVGASPTGITVADGSVWVADSGDGTVDRIDPDPARPRVLATIPVGGRPQALAVAGGHVWVTVDARVIPRTPTGGGTLRIDAVYDVDFMDPGLAYGPLSWQLEYATCAKLVNYPDRQGAAGVRLVPEVAQSLPAISDGGRTYVFTVRRGFRFSPPLGTPVTAQTFKAAIERSLRLSPAADTPVAEQLADVVGVRAFLAGRAGHVSGVVARGNTLTIHLSAPVPDLTSRLAQPFFCAVPPDTPANPNGERIVPSAGPYYVTSYTPGQGVVLTRNPNYHGSRPRRWARIEVSVGVPSRRAIAQVEAGTTDYARDGEVSAAQGPALAARYGTSIAAAKHGRQQYFVETEPGLDILVLNTQRPLLSHLALRQAINDAIDRTALARAGDLGSSLPEKPTSNYIPPGVPGSSEVQAYPLVPDLTRARRLARPFRGDTLTFITCDRPQCDDQAQILTRDLAAIGLRLNVREISIDALFSTLSSDRGWDIGVDEWLADYPDPDDFLNLLLGGGGGLPAFEDPPFAAKLAAAARLTGTRRYLTYARLATDLERNGAPFAVYAILSTHELFAARIGCQNSGAGIYGTDIAALCIRRSGS